MKHTKDTVHYTPEEFERLTPAGKWLFMAWMTEMPVGTSMYYRAVVENPWAFEDISRERIEEMKDILRKRNVEWEE